MKKLLIVDDTKTDRDLLSQIFEDEGFDIITCKNGKEAVILLHDQGYMPDCILMDVCMDEMDGPTAFSIIKSQPQFDAVPFIFITGRDKSVELFDPRKVADFIVKPYDPDNLVMRVKKAIGETNE